MAEGSMEIENAAMAGNASSADNHQDSVFSTPEGALDITPNKDGGVMKVILKEGVTDESPSANDEVYVHYTGTLTNGDKFDSSRDRGELFKFKLQTGCVIKAWDIGVSTMKKGEVCKLICRSEYAYGKSGSPPKIGPNATLIFEIELFHWKGEDLSEEQDGSIIRSVLVKGDGYTTPNDGATVEVFITGAYQGKEFESRTVKFVVGEGAEHDVVFGVDQAIKKFKKGEKSKLKIKSVHAFGSAGSANLGIPPNAEVVYEVTLVNFEKAKESWEMDASEKLDQSNIAKEKGTELFKMAKFSQALKQYKKVINWVKDEKELSDEQEAQKKALLLAAHLNSALCHLRLEEYSNARTECSSALEMDSINEKALFRRGQALMGTQDWDLAKTDFQNVLNIDPSNKAAKSQISLAEQKLREEKEQQKKTYAGMFQKFAEKDTKHSTTGAAKTPQCKPDGDTTVEASH